MRSGWCMQNPNLERREVANASVSVSSMAQTHVEGAMWNRQLSRSNLLTTW